MLPELKSAKAKSPRATVLVAHGYAEHYGRYHALTKALQNAGYDVYGYDHPGHGRTGGPRARVDVGHLIRVHQDVRRQVLREMRTRKLFLFGHSMGGLVTAASALLRPRGVAGVCLSGPAFETAPVPTWAFAPLGILARVLPGLPLISLEASAVSRDRAVVADYERDPLNYHGRVPALTAITMVRNGYQALRRAQQWSLPLLVFQGTADKLVNPRATERFARSATRGSADVTYVPVRDAYHEVFNEPQAPELRAQLIAWLNERI
ncbi:alpha/beta hydrolase [Gleimia hominis]|uniref:alpha/beta hydrolase n=1 Tax=Gleimia hominis TaxID=595468 RepID=UPI000C80FD2F|nr:alpha/beta hydrolase [Gleimia hominis]WIK64562.1 alpha/beta hydrolase [Gleimia hominis]